jgi:hypothetical protein
MRSKCYGGNGARKRQQEERYDVEGKTILATIYTYEYLRPGKTVL